MKKSLYLFMLNFLFITGFAQNKVVYDANVEQRNVSSFHAIKISNGIQLMLQQSNTEAVAVSAETAEERNAIKTEVVNGELRIYLEQKAQKWWDQLKGKGFHAKAYVSVKNLDHIDGSSGSRTKVDGTLNATNLSIDLSSGASFTGAVKASKMDIDQNSGATSDENGTVDDLPIHTSSGAKFSGYDLTANTGKANASSGSKIELSINKEFSASASSGGGIEFKGAGALTNVSTSSGGRVRKI